MKNLNFLTQLCPKKGWWHTRLRKISDLSTNLRLEKKLKSKSEFEIDIGLVAQNPEKNSNFLRNLRFELISALVALVFEIAM